MHDKLTMIGLIGIMFVYHFVDRDQEFKIYGLGFRKMWLVAFNYFHKKAPS